MGQGVEVVPRWDGAGLKEDDRKVDYKNKRTSGQGGSAQGEGFHPRKSQAVGRRRKGEKVRVREKPQKDRWNETGK